ncbi:TolB family protein [Nonomuraea sp. NPDC050790]|uniref:TolB family protein n=1 Tax=Nonomuraea sp. NPDC050790 TaxID=3364371 RepID=UPI0037B63E79
MTDLEDRLSGVLSGAADRAPRVPDGLAATVKARHRRRRARTAAVRAAAAVVVVAGGVGVAVDGLGASAQPSPAVDGTGQAPPPIEKVWPEAVRKIPAKLPDGRAYHPQLLLDDDTLLVMTGVSDGRRQFLWRYDLRTGRPTRVAEIPPTKGSAIFADGVAAGGGNIVWWASYKEAGGPRVARIWTVPAAGGSPRRVADVPLGNVMKQGHINGLQVAGSDVVFAYEKGGVHRVPLSGGTPRPVKGAERHHVLEWPWVGAHHGKAIFRELLNVETGERRDAVVKADEEVRCGVERCAGVAVRNRIVKVERPRDPSGKEIRCGTKRCPDTVRSQTVVRRFVRDRDGSLERELPSGFQRGDDAGLERFFKVDRQGSGLSLYDVDTGRSADLGIRPDAKGVMAIPDGGLDRLMTYPIKDRMYVVDLAAIE